MKTTTDLSINITGANAEDVCVWADLFGVTLSDNSEIVIDVKFDKGRKAAYIEPLQRLSDEKYIIEVLNADKCVEVRLACPSKKAMFYGLSDILDRISKDTLSLGEITGYPLFKTRGYIEGFYGKPWSFEERCSVLKLMAKNRMNTVYFAPKDDDYHRELWREQYPREELEKLAVLVKLSDEYAMDFYYCLAPGLSIKYTSEQEFDSLKAKTQQLYDIGVRHFGLLLDDIDEEFAFEEDKKAYGEIVNAHTSLIQRYYTYIKGINNNIRLTVCPMLYNGRGNEYYISKFGQNIEPDIQIFWTGRDVCSRDLTSFEALKFIENTYHKPLYWDNYPVNDGTMHNEMHISPIINRDKDLYKYSEGIIANCMEYAECSKIPLITFADYLWDSENYNPDSSFENAVEQVVGAENSEAFITFADHLYTSCLKDNNSKRMYKIFQKVEKAFASGEIGTALMSAGEYVEKMNACCEYLKQELPICRELSKWSKKFFVACDIINKLLELISEGEGGIRDEIFKLIDKYDAMPAKLTDINLKEELGNLMNINFSQ